MKTTDLYITKNVYVAHSENGKTVEIENGHVRDISSNEGHTVVMLWPDEKTYTNYNLGSKGTKGKARVFINRKCIFIGTVAEYDELCAIGKFI